MKALDRFFLLRPLLWIPAIALFEAGRAEAGGAWWTPPTAVPGLLSLLSLLSAVHLGNAWNDRAGDRANRKGGLVASGAVAGREVALLAAAFVGMAFVFAASPSVTPGARWLLAASAGLGALYVLPPFEWKRRPGLDLLAQAAGYGVVAFGLGMEAAGAARPGFAAVVRLAPYALGIAAVGVVTMLADRAGDALAGQKTTAVALGPARAATLALGLALATAVAGLVAGTWAPALWGILAFAVLSLEDSAAAKGSGEWNRIAVRLQVAFLLLLLPASPVPLGAATLLGAAVASYDRRRGGQGYPWKAVTWDSGAAGERYRTTRV